MTALHEGPLMRLEHDHEALPPTTGEISRPRALEAVGRLSAHLVALERTVYPAAARHLVDGPAQVRAARAAARRVSVALRRLDRHLTGDWLLGRVPLDSLWQAVVEAGREHARAERRLLRELDLALDGGTVTATIERYQAALRAAPSRPHPHVPTHGALSRLAGRLMVLVDRTRDTLDGRPTFLTRSVTPARPPGLWAAYLIGTAQGLAPREHR